MKAAGKHRWFVPDAYLPAESSHGLESHEAACLLNVSDEDARVAFTFYFEDREPIGDVVLSLGARRTRHVRLDRADELGVELPRGTPFAYAVESDVPVVLQHSRLDTTPAAHALHDDRLLRGKKRPPAGTRSSRRSPTPSRRPGSAERERQDWGP